jgi:hypothetical protein
MGIAFCDVGYEHVNIKRNVFQAYMNTVNPRSIVSGSIVQFVVSMGRPTSFSCIDRSFSVPRAKAMSRGFTRREHSQLNSCRIRLSPIHVHVLIQRPLFQLLCYVSLSASARKLSRIHVEGRNPVILCQNTCPNFICR